MPNAVMIAFALDGMSYRLYDNFSSPATDDVYMLASVLSDDHHLHADAPNNTDNTIETTLEGHLYESTLSPAIARAFEMH